MKNIFIALFLSLFACNAQDRVKYQETENIDHSGFTSILQKYVSNGEVNYQGIKDDASTFNTYLELLKANHPAENWSREQKLAYWINAYNAFTIQLILNNYPLKSIKDISSPWDQEFIQIRDNLYSLNNIEHEILRKMNEPRIHFAIVCASFSCPELRNEAFVAMKLESQLEEQTSKFINDSKRNMISEKKAEVSEIFNWFSGDFESLGGVEGVVRKYSKTSLSDKLKISFMDYNWDLNE